MHWDSQVYIGTKDNTKTVTENSIEFAQAFWLATILTVSMYAVLKDVSCDLASHFILAKLPRQGAQNILQSVTARWRPILSQAPPQSSNKTKSIKTTKGEALEITPACKNTLKLLPVSVEIYLGTE